MITASQIQSYWTASKDYKEIKELYKKTKDLKEKLQSLRQKRNPFYLTLLEFDEILRWKLGNQYNRQKKRRESNSEELVRTITQTAFQITHPDKEYEVELRLGILCLLRGVGVPVASAILALTFPEEYGVIDFRVWRQLFGEEKRDDFSIEDYKQYLNKLRNLAKELEWTVQEVDLAIWAYDKSINKNKKK